MTSAWRNRAMHWFFYVLCAFFFAGTAAAQPNAFTVTGVTVEQPAGALEKRRAEALELAGRRGAMELLNRLTPESTWHRQGEIIGSMNFDQAVAGVQIHDEQLGRTYMATFDISFSPNYIRETLTKLGIPFSEVEPIRAIIIPVLDLPENQLLWSEINPWLVAFRTVAAAQENPLLEAVMPLGDASEMAMLSAEQALAGAEDRILALANQYNAEAAIVATVRTERRGLRQLIAVNGQWIGPRNVQPIGFTVPIDEGAPFSASLQVAAQRVLASFAARWRNDHLIRVDKPGRVYVRYAAQNPTELMRLRLQLKRLAEVRSVNVKLLSLERSVLQIDFYGQPSQLQQSIREAGYDVTPEGGLWVLANAP